MKTNNKSLKVNALLSTIKTISNAIFPLITYPYITRIISVEGIGKISFSQSIVTYFLVIAGFGVYHFAVKNGAAIRDDREKFNLFANEVFTINCVTALISFFLLLIILLLPTKLSDYRMMIYICSISIVSNPFSIEWLYTIYEDFGYITVRTIFIHIVSLFLIFMCVKDENDVYIYCVLTIMASSLGSLFNYVHSKKYITLKLTKKTKWKEYKTPLFIFFVNGLTTTVYVNSDITLLGFMCSDWNVGLYGVATKIYSIIKQIFNSVVAVVIPRLAYLKNKDMEKFLALIRIIVSGAAFFIFPAALGIIIIRRELILFIAGRGYMEATNALVVLAVAIICATYANIFTYGLLICLGLEKYVLRTTLISASLNLLLNFVFIPLFKEVGAAFTTVLAEVTVFTMALYYSRKEIKGLFDINSIVKSVIGCIIMYAISIPVGKALVEVNYIIRLVVIVCVCVCVYIGSEVILKNEIILKIRHLY